MNIFSLMPDKYKQELKIKLGAPHMYWSITNMKKNGFNPKIILDIGAYHGEWTTEVRKIFPDSCFLMFEANPEKKKILETMCCKFKNIEFEISLLGSKSGQITEFNVLETASSALEELNETNGRKIKLPVFTLSEILKNRKINKVDFIKLDVQGYELEILKGAEQYLEQCEAILTEVSFLALHKNCPLLFDVVNYLDKFNFCAYDICSVSARRPFDRALWQTDLIFVKKDSPLIVSKRYY